MPEFEFKDNFGDTLTVDNDDGHIALTVEEENVGACAVMSPKTALEVADAIYSVCGGAVPKAPVRKASDMTAAEALMRVAAMHGLTTSFRYKKPDEAASWRSFVPEAVKVEDDHVRFIGIDIDANETRAFRSDRIMSDVVTGRRRLGAGDPTARRGL